MPFTNTIRFRNAFLFMALLCCFASSFASASQPVSPDLNALKLSNKDSRSHPADFIQVLKDIPPEVTIEDIVSGKFEQQFKPLDGKTTMGFSTDTVWSRVLIYNDSDHSGWFLRHLFPATSELSFYSRDYQGRFVKKLANLEQKFTERGLPDTLMTFQLEIPPGQQQTIYLRHNTTSTVNFEFSILSSGELLKSSRSEMFYQALYYLSLIFIAVLSFFWSFNPGARRYAYVTVFTLANMLGYSLYEGYFHLITGVVPGVWQISLLSVCLGLSLFALYGYLRSIAPSLKQERKTNFVLYSLAVFWVFNSLMVLDSVLAQYQFYALVVGYIVSCLLACFLVIRAYLFRELRSITLGGAVLVFSLLYIVQGLHRLGVLEGFEHIGESIRIGEMILAYAMAFSIRDYVRSLNQQLITTSLKFENIFNNLQDGMCIIDRHYYLIEANPACYNIEHDSQQHLLGSNFLNTSGLCQTEENRVLIKSRIDQAFEGRQSLFEMTVTLPDLGERAFNISIVPYSNGFLHQFVILSARDISNYRRFQKQIDHISHVLSKHTGDSFFEHLGLELAAFTHSDQVLIATINESENRAETLVYVVDGKLRENTNYSLKGTPCNNVVEGKACVYSDRVAELFPEDLQLTTDRIQSYIGIPLKSTKGHTLGIIVLLNRTPIESEHSLDVLGLFSQRAASEMERLVYDKALMDAQQKLSLHINHTPLGVIEFDANNIVVEWNDSATRIFGYERDETVGLPLSKTVFSGDSLTGLEQLLESNQFSERITLSHACKDGRRIYCEWFITPLTEEGVTFGYAALFSDITIQKDVLSALELKEREQSDILESMADAVVTIDETGKVLSFNHSASKIFGYEKEEVIGRLVNMLMPDSVAQHHGQYLTNYLVTGEAKILGIGREVEGLTKEGKTFPMRLSIAELPQLKTGVRRFIGTCHDLSLLKQQELQLLQKQKMESLGSLTGGIAHDFNNILGIISGYTSLLSSSLDEDDIEASYVEEIERATDRGAKLTKKLLSLSKDKPIETQTVSLNEIVAGMEEVVSKALTPRITFSTQLGDAPAYIDVDSHALEDALLNLAINSMHAMNGEGQLAFIVDASVTVNQKESSYLGIKPGIYHRLRVKDNGCGIPKEIQARIFDPFFTTKAEKGTGLGLSQVYGFMKQSDGVIRVNPDVEDGAEFRLYFPVHEEKRLSAGTDSVNSSFTELSVGKERILVVDDEEPLMKATAAQLQSVGYEVTSTVSSVEALNMISTQAYDLLLSDVVMPDMDGYELIKKAKKIQPGLKALLMSGYISQSTNKKIRDAGQSILNKPFSKQDLVACVREQLDHRK